MPGPGGSGGNPSPDGYCCGRYASYWNAFLCIFNNKSVSFANMVFFSSLTLAVIYLLKRELIQNCAGDGASHMVELPSAAGPRRRNATSQKFISG